MDASNAPLQFQQPNTTQTLAGLLNLKTSIQAQQIQQQEMQRLQMANQQSGIDLQETQAARQLLADPQYQNGDGTFNFTKLQGPLMAAAPKNGAAFLSNLGNAQTAFTNAKAAVNTLDTQSRGIVGSMLYSILDQPPEKRAAIAANTLDQFEKSYPSLAPAIDLARGQLQATGGDPGKVSGVINMLAKGVQPPETQQAMSTPQGISVDNGQQFSTVSTKPNASVPAGEAIPGTSGQHQLPPTTPIIGGPSGTQPGYLGPQRPGAAESKAQGADGETLAILQKELGDAQAGRNGLTSADVPAIQREISRLGAGFVASGLPAGQGENIANNVQEMGRHFASLQDASAGAPLVQSLRGNIKALATKAITGTESDKLAYVNGLLAHLPGFSGEPSTDLKTATDMLEKNMSQLNLTTPAATDAARALVTVARPNSHMTADAISEAADQVASQVQANMAMRNVLSGYKMAGDVQGYQAQRQRLEKIADPRVWQFMSLPDAQSKQQFMGRLPMQERQQLLQSTKQLEQMGLIP